MNSSVRTIAGVLAVIGALNWGLVAIAEFDLVAEIFGLEFGETNAATRIVYGLVGIAGVVLAADLIISWRSSVRTHESQPVSKAVRDERSIR